MNIGRKNQFLTNINHRQWMDKFFHQNDCTIGLKAGHGTKKWKGLYAGALLPNNKSLITNHNRKDGSPYKEYHIVLRQVEYCRTCHYVFVGSGTIAPNYS